MATLTYARHFAVLGKLCKLYDDASAASGTQRTLISTYCDQTADGVAASLAMVIAQQTYAQQFNSALSSGEDTRKTIALNAAKAYFTNAYFTDELTTTPDSTGIVDVLTALQTEMGAGVDNVTLGTKTTTGLVNFFDAILADEGEGAGTWNTESDATADYRDAVYVVSAVI
jgi:hypothetical protein